MSKIMAISLVSLGTALSGGPVSAEPTYSASSDVSACIAYDTRVQTSALTVAIPYDTTKPGLVLIIR